MTESVLKYTPVLFRECKRIVYDYLGKHFLTRGREFIHGF
jgi:hypothetical protein